MDKYIVVDMLAEADPNNKNRVGLNDPQKYPMENFHPTRYVVYKEGENSGIVAYIPDWHQNSKEIAQSIANSLESVTLVV